MSLRGELLVAAQAQRDHVLASISPELAAVALREWTAIVDRLASGAPYRIARNELPESHPERWRGRALDVLVLAGDELTAVA